MSIDDRRRAPDPRRRPSPILMAVLALLVFFILWFIGDTFLWNTAESPADPGVNVMPAQPEATAGLGPAQSRPAQPGRGGSGDAVADGLGVTGAQASPNG